MSRRDLWIAVMVAIVLIASACAGDSGSSTSTPSGSGDDVPSRTVTESSVDATQDDTSTPSTVATGAEPPGDVGTCTIEVSGDRSDQVTWTQDMTSFSSDHWLSEEQLRDSLEFLGDTDTLEDYRARDDAVLTWLLLSCAPPLEPTADTPDSQLSVLINATDPTQGADLPMGPGTYTISGGLFDTDGPSGTVTGTIVLSDEDIFGTVDGSGELVITTWDTQRVEGSVDFQAVESLTDDPEEVTVRMEFSFQCLPEVHGVCG